MWVIEASENAKCLPAWFLYTQVIRFLAPLLGAVAKLIVKVGVLPLSLSLSLKAPLHFPPEVWGSPTRTETARI